MRRNQDLISVRYFWDKSGGILYSLEAFSFFVCLFVCLFQICRDSSQEDHFSMFMFMVGSYFSRISGIS